jgi:phosphoglycolate phosphatase
MKPQISIDNEVIHSSPEVVLFDKDGTLIDIHHYWVSMINIRSEYIVDRWFPEVSNKQEIKYKLIETMGVDVQSGKMNSNGPVGVKPRPFIVHVTADVVRNMGCEISDDDMEDIFLEVDTETSKNMLPLLKLLPGVKELLMKLKSFDIQTVIVSTDITSRARKAMQALEMDQYFAEIIGGDLVKNAKPASDLAELALDKVGCMASSAIVIGDHPVDMLMGKNAGIDVNIGVLTGLSRKKSFNECQCNIVTDLKSINVESLQC